MFLMILLTRRVVIFFTRILKDSECFEIIGYLNVAFKAKKSKYVLVCIVHFYSKVFFEFFQATHFQSDIRLSFFCKD